MRSVEEEELMVDIRQWYEELKRTIGKEGELEGKLEGRLAGRRASRVATHTLYSTRCLGRPLSRAERAVLAERLECLDEDRLVDLVLTREGEAIAAWLAEPTSR